METFNFRFNEKIFSSDLNKKFTSADDLSSYFLSFRKHYDDFTKSFNPKSTQRMKGFIINNYKTLQEYSCTLNDHYRLLLIVGKNGFDIWLNDLVK